MNIYEMVTNRIIAELEKGLIPWQKPWSGANTAAYSLSTGKPYSIINQMILGKSGAWATYAEIQKRGGKVNKGEKASFVVLWKFREVNETDDNGQEVKKTIPMLRYFNVFHIESQTTGITLKKHDIPAAIAPIAEAERIKTDYINRENIRIDEIITNEAFYSPARDYIQVPCRNQYTTAEEFYSTLYHEMIHSTGHVSRLNRLDTGIIAAFGSETYSKEELVAEIGSAALLNKIGLETSHTFRNSATYIQSWLTVLKNDSKFIVSASGKAEKAINYILNGEA